MERLKWEKLLCEERIRGSASGKVGEDNVRNEFEADYDRIVGSSSVRRLQDKAQVFPLQKNDFVRTRLTHSIEVSAMARSFGKKVGKCLEKADPGFNKEMTEKLSAMLQTAGLIHDLGNPPFGHYGESVIRDWFKQNEQLDKSKFTEQQMKDFEFFDGNVQNLRIVTKLQTMNDAYGANFTFGTLATIIKYPVDSCHGMGRKQKFGYYQSEEDIVNKIWKETGLQKGVRHPATYLLEAADDIIYLCDDIEDGVKKGYINWDYVYENIIKVKLPADERKEYEELYDYLDNHLPDPNMDVNEKVLARVHVFRNRIQTYLFDKAVEEFMDNYEAIMHGIYKKKELLACENQIVDCLKSITGEYCFSCREVLSLELVGDRVIRELLNIFSKSLIKTTEDDINKTDTYPGKVYKLISENYKFIARYDYEKKTFRKFDEIDDYARMHLIVDFISGMTDSYAVNLYKELTGISLPE